MVATEMMLESGGKGRVVTRTEVHQSIEETRLDFQVIMGMAWSDQVHVGSDRKVRRQAVFGHWKSFQPQAVFGHARNRGRLCQLCPRVLVPEWDEIQGHAIAPDHSGIGVTWSLHFGMS
jgi:hypothetical protein